MLTCFPYFETYFSLSCNEPWNTIQYKSILFFIEKMERWSILRVFSPLCFWDALLVSVPQNSYMNAEYILSSARSWVPTWDAIELSWADCTFSPQFRILQVMITFCKRSNLHWAEYISLEQLERPRAWSGRCVKWWIMLKSSVSFLQSE